MAFWNKIAEEKAEQAAPSRKSRRLKIACLILAIAVLGFTAGGVYAKYTYNNVGKSTVRARDFYFKSPQLDGETHELNSDVTSLAINLQNFFNTEVYTEDDIRYTVTVTDNDEGSNAVVKIDGAEKSVGKISGMADNTSTVILESLKSGKNYVVSVTARNCKEEDGVEKEYGYEKTLSATFKIKPAESGFYKYAETKDGVCFLTVKTIGGGGMVSITIPKGLNHDSLDPNTVEHLSADGKTITQEFGSYASRTYRFFPSISGKSFNTDSFTSIKLNGTTDAVKMDSADDYPID